MTSLARTVAVHLAAEGHDLLANSIQHGIGCVSEGHWRCNQSLCAIQGMGAESDYGALAMKNQRPISVDKDHYRDRVEKPGRLSGPCAQRSFGVGRQGNDVHQGLHGGGPVVLIVTILGGRGATSNQHRRAVRSGYGSVGVAELGYEWLTTTLRRLWNLISVDYVGSAID